MIVEELNQEGVKALQSPEVSTVWWRDSTSSKPSCQRFFTNLVKAMTLLSGDTATAPISSVRSIKGTGPWPGCNKNRRSFPKCCATKRMSSEWKKEAERTSYWGSAMRGLGRLDKDRKDPCRAWSASSSHRLPVPLRSRMNAKWVPSPDTAGDSASERMLVPSEARTMREPVTSASSMYAAPAIVVKES